MTEKALEEVVTETAEAAEETTQENSGAASDKAKKMTKQDENWELVTFLNFTSVRFPSLTTFIPTS